MQLSVYAAEEELRQGFITIQGGHRIGVAGRTMAFGQDIRLMKSISFINIRVAHQIQGCANQVMDYLYSDDGRFLNTLGDIAAQVRQDHPAAGHDPSGLGRTQDPAIRQKDTGGVRGSGG